MKSEIAQKLETFLNGMSQEEFDKVWNPIVQQKFPSSFQEVLKNMIMTPTQQQTVKEELLKFLKQDSDFYPFRKILDEAVEEMNIYHYLMDKTYIDISYLVVEDFIINLDEIYFLCRDYLS